MFKSILVAVDGSDAANAGFKSALQLAGDQHAKLVVLHVIDDTAMAVDVAGGYLPASYVDTLYDSLRKNGETILGKARAAARAAGVEITPVLAESRGQTVAQAILRQARRSRADVIVLGTHGRRGLARILMGSDAEAVLREAPVPVVLVRRPAHEKRATARKRVPSPATAAKKAGQSTRPPTAAGVMTPGR